MAKSTYAKPEMTKERKKRKIEKNREEENGKCDRKNREKYTRLRSIRHQSHAMQPYPDITHITNHFERTIYHFLERTPAPERVPGWPTLCSEGDFGDFDFE
ncbi:tRNA methyltransferase [Histoplasma ohiense]|nr:tRNA methyltransferase [Histoplasma ohiense (nom. inval.)]